MIKIAVPNKGRMFNPTIELLRKSGFEPKEINERKLCVETNCGEIKILFMRNDEIGFYVESNVADLGITGYDIIVEKKISVEKILDLNYGSCKLVLAGEKNKKLRNGVRIATKYQNISKDYLRKRGVKAKIIDSPGATEIKPQLGLTDFIIDITSTGSTLKVNGLSIYDVILSSNAVLIGNKKSLKEKSGEISDIKLAIQSVISAENKSYVMFNISKKILDRIIDQIPCMRAPTIVKTSDENVVSVQTVVPTSDISRTITKLKNFGTTDILVLDIKRVVV
ncbi:MAG: ATP phosphoribosyltransferase [Thermoplasmatales archaeon]|nr:ATP phosphoribosyltransferase [Thermoplasmatales archaeon]